MNADFESAKDEGEDVNSNTQLELFRRWQPAVVKSKRKRKQWFVELFVELQEEVRILEAERGTIHEGAEQKALILAEEVFETLKILRSRSGVATAKSRPTDLGDELADVLFVTAAIANRVSTSLDMAIFECAKDSVPHFAIVISEATSSSQDAALEMALAIATEVLTILTLVRKVQPEEAVSSPYRQASLPFALGRLATLVDMLAQVDAIDLRDALHRKLQKDQFRLWSSGHSVE
jgi:NTP pyrophosphatase (non-canonical NTP hydrolase)